jgi:aspartyl-tRNA(Asn)/glutamyl-tRNA(Gln) amidotransferase subunit C
MQRTDIEHLATLARLQLTEEEITKYQKEMTDILGYVVQINTIAGDSPAALESASVRNVLREDTDVVLTDTYTERLLAAAPQTQDGFIKVQKILDTNNGA